MRITFFDGSEQPKTAQLNLPRFFAGVALIVAIFVSAQIARATTPNPGHPWSEVGDGVFAVANNQTAVRTYTFPDADATVLTGNADVTVAQGGTGWSALQANTVLLGNGSSAVATTTAGTNGQVLGLVNGVPSWVSTTTLATITGTLGLSQGGTNASLTASNGGIVYSGSSALAVLAGTATAGQVLQSGSSAAPSWSTATYPSTAGTLGNVLESDGTNFVSATPDTIKSWLTRPFWSTGAVTTATTPSLTSYSVGIFNLPTRMVVNQVAFNVVAVTTAGTMRVCVYTEDGATKKIDVVSGTPAVGTNFVAVSAVTLDPGNYYVALGCATTCSNTYSANTATVLAMLTTTPPNSKEKYEGTVTMTSGTCNTTLPAITQTNNKGPLVRLDN